MPCLLDITLGALKDIEAISDLWRFYEEKNTYGLSTNLFWTYHNEFFIGCCKAHIYFLYQTDNELIEYCRHLCQHRRRVSTQRQCFDISGELQMHKFCSGCLNNLCEHLEEKLNSLTTTDNVAQRGTDMRL